MAKKATTKDELFLLKLHQLATEMGDPCQEIDRYRIGKAIGQNDRGIDTIARDLAQANFINKGVDKAYYLTPNGLRLVEQLLQER